MSSCWNDASKANLQYGEWSHVHRRQEKNQEKAITKFSPHVFESPIFKGSNDS